MNKDVKQYYYYFNFKLFNYKLFWKDGRVVSNFIVQKLQVIWQIFWFFIYAKYKYLFIFKGKALTVYGGGKQTRSFCFVDGIV